MQGVQRLVFGALAGSLLLPTIVFRPESDGELPQHITHPQHGFLLLLLRLKRFSRETVLQFLFRVVARQLQVCVVPDIPS